MVLFSRTCCTLFNFRASFMACSSSAARGKVRDPLVFSLDLHTYSLLRKKWFSLLARNSHSPIKISISLTIFFKKLYVTGFLLNF